MAKIITQQTYDDVVKENIVEFSMSPEDARQETIEQFEAQGINLSNIIKDLCINEDTGLTIIGEAIEKLRLHESGEIILSTEHLNDALVSLKLECDKSVPHRVLAANSGILQILLSISDKHLLAEQENTNVLESVLRTINSLITKQPDIFNPDTLIVCIKALESYPDSDGLVCLVLRILANACVMHEINRQNIMNANIVKFLKPLLNRESAVIMKDVCMLFRYLILDDDVRVEFGKAHDHAKAIATEVLADLTTILNKFSDLPDLQSDLILTIASLTVRNEYCLLVDESGGLTSVLLAMRKHSDHVKLVRESFQLLRALGGNDVVKQRIIQQGAAPLITDILCIHKENALLAKAALMCLATITLRSKENSTALAETGISEEIVETMKLHPTNKAVQRNGAWAIRNIVSRSRDLCDSFLKWGAEDQLNAAMAAHPTVAQDLKAALRDLGCKVELKEEWTGTRTVPMASE